MSGWIYSEIGISTNHEDIALKRQLMKCIGLEKTYNGMGDYNEKRAYACGNEFDIIYEENDMIFGEYGDYLEKVELEPIFSIYNMVFPGTYVHIQMSSGSTVSGDYAVENILLDPVEMKLKKQAFGEVDTWYPDYCSGCYRILDDDMLMDPEEYEEYMSQHEDICAIYEWDGEKTTAYKFVKPSKYKSYVQNIIDESIKNGFTELTALMLEKFKDVSG